MRPSSCNPRLDVQRDGISVRLFSDTPLSDPSKYLAEFNGFLGYTMAITAPAEISAAATLIDYWESDINPAVFFTVFIVLIMVLNFCPVKAYGEVSRKLFPHRDPSMKAHIY